jgi:hypothetical protein
MAALYANPRDVAIRIKAKSRMKTSGGVGGKATLLPKDRASLRFFKLREDVIGSGTVEVYAEYSNQDGDSLGGYPKVVSWTGIIDGAQVGYLGLYTLVSGKWVFVQGEGCITGCSSDGSITPGSPPDGAVDGEYPGHTVSYSGLDAGVTITGLPPGLSASGGVISGTPTAEGEYFVTITGTAPKTGPGATGSCTITRMVRIVVGPAEEG